MTANNIDLMMNDDYNDKLQLNYKVHSKTMHKQNDVERLRQWCRWRWRRGCPRSAHSRGKRKSELSCFDRPLISEDYSPSEVSVNLASRVDDCSSSQSTNWMRWSFVLIEKGKRFFILWNNSYWQTRIFVICLSISRCSVAQRVLWCQL